MMFDKSFNSLSLILVVLVFISGCRIFNKKTEAPSKLMIIDSLGDDGDENRHDDFYWVVDNKKLTFSNFTVNEKDNAKITIRNNSDSMYYISMGIYKMYDYSERSRGRVRNEKHYSQESKFLSPGRDITLNASLPDCMATINLYSGPAPDTLYWDNRTVNRLIGYTYQLNENDIPEENDIMDGHSEFDDFPNDNEDGYHGIAGLGYYGDEDDGDQNAGPVENLCNK